MGILEKIGMWAAANIPVVTTIVKKAADVMYKGAEYVESLVRGRKILEDIDIKTEKEKPGSNKKPVSRPSIIDDDYDASEDNVVSELIRSIDESKNKLLKVETDNISEHKKIQLQIDVMELIVSAQTVERFTNNINLHAANLQIHLQTIQNTAGLMDDVNRQRRAVKALMQTVNHLINVVGKSGDVKPIAGLDVDMKTENISIKGAYDAYENTKNLLINEISSFSNALDDQLGRVENVRVSARKNPQIMHKINSWIESDIEPNLLAAKQEAEDLKAKLIVIPALEARLKRELEFIHDDAGEGA